MGGNPGLSFYRVDGCGLEASEGRRSVFVPVDRFEPWFLATRLGWRRT